MLLDESGIITIDEAVINSDSFKKIMKDGIVTDEEIQEQTKRVIELLKEASMLPEAEQAFIEKLLVETCVLSAITQAFNKQSENR